MLISYNWLQTYFEKPLPSAEKLAGLFSAHSFEVESVEPKGADYILDVKILPDRAHYLLSHKGVAREIQAILDMPITFAPKKEISVKKGISIPVVRMESDGCLRYIARRIENVIIADSPAWLKERLLSVGQRPINLIVDIANFVMLDIGQPLHIFDMGKVRGEIIVRWAQSGEKITLLAGDEVSLLETDLVIADTLGPLALAGIKGGKRAEVVQNTKSIIVESANFNPVSIRRTATRLNLRNDASKRFENEITPDLASRGMDNFTSLLAEISPDISVGQTFDAYPKPAESWRVMFSADQISEIIGAKISGFEIKKILQRMDCKIEKEAENIVVTPPFDRLDMVIPEDIADEVGRIWGYEKIRAILPPNLSEIISPDKVFFWAEKIKDVLIGRGYSEVMLYSLVSHGAYTVTYPIASDKGALRENLSENLAQSLKINVLNADLLALDAVKIFEIGKVFPESGEMTNLALGVAFGKKKKIAETEGALIDDIKALEKTLGLAVSPKIKETDFGFIAEVSLDKIIAKLPAKENISGLDFSPVSKDKKYTPFSPYPFIVRDIALFVETKDSADIVRRAIEKSAGDFLVSARLFDEFKKGNQTSLAFRLVFQSMSRTLTDKEVNAAMERVYKALKEGSSDREIR